MFADQITSLIGAVPAGCEPLLWFACFIVLCLFLDLVFGIIWALVKWVGDR